MRNLKYTQDNKYLAVINENGLWIKDQVDNQIVIIHSEKINGNMLQNIFITVYNSEFQNKKNIIAKNAIIDSKIWKINDCINLENETLDTDKISGFLPCTCSR